MGGHPPECEDRHITVVLTAVVSISEACSDAEHQEEPWGERLPVLAVAAGTSGEAAYWKAPSQSPLLPAIHKSRGKKGARRSLPEKL